MSSAPKERLTLRLRSPTTRYKPISRIAAGGMAEVWRGEAALAGGEVVPVAIKRVLPNLEDPNFLPMIEDEARLGMLLRHPNVVRVFDARNVGGTYIVIMELVDGDTLKGLLDSAEWRPMPLAAALYIGRELLRALGYSHNATDEKGNPLFLVHWDVSPHNLLLGRDGGVKLSDFGLAEATTNRVKRAEGMIGGKFGYLAPELIHRQKGDYRIDLFAAGIVIWEMIAGRRLFQGGNDRDTIQQVARCEIPRLSIENENVPSQVDDFLSGLLTPNPDQRYQTGDEAAQALDVLVQWLEPNIGPEDVGLMLAVHGALKAQRKELEARPLEVFDMLMNELEEFAAQAAGGGGMGASPLDPSLFGRVR